MESKFFLKLGNVGFKVAYPLEYAIFGVVHLLLQDIDAPTLFLNRIKMVAQRSKDSLDGLIVGMKMFEYFLDVIFVVSKLTIGIFQLLAELFHFVLNLLVKLFTVGDVLLAAVNNFHKGGQLTKYIAVEVHRWCDDHNRVALGESDNCDSIASRPLT